MASEIKNELLAQQFAHDPRIIEAKNLLKAALSDHQKSLTGIRPANPELQKSYAETLKHFSELRGGSTYYPYLGSGFGHGPLVELADGSVKYDFISGIGVHYLGHNHPALLESGIDAALENTVMQGNLQQNIGSSLLLKQLLQMANRCGAKLAHGFITSSGAMANENALKILFQKRFPANRILAFEHAFAGRTIALSHITDKPAYRQGLPENLSVDYIPFFDPENPKASTEAAARILCGHLERHPGAYAGMIFELIQGEGAGYRAGDSNFFKTLMEILRKSQVAILMDEIQTFGRTSEVFAFQYFGLDEYVDILTLGKLSQVCATLIRSDFKPKPGLVSQTFTAATSSIKAAQVILNFMLKENLLGPDGKIMRLSNHFVEKLKDLSLRHPTLAKGPHGLGGMIAFTPLGGKAEAVNLYLKNLFQAGVMGFLAGDQIARARFLLPVGATEKSDIDMAFPIIEKVLHETAAELS